jgi:uncharacterized membrane protein
VSSADDPGFSHEDGDVEPGTPVIDEGKAGMAGLGKAPSKRIASAISGKRYKKRDLVKIDALRPTLAEFIRRDYPNLPRNAMISQRELTRYRGRYIEQLLQEEHGEFSELDRQVAESIAKQDTIAENTEEEFEEHRTLGDRASDRLASFGGSWYFLISFGMVLIAWMALNIGIGTHAFDPYPFILLNLCLSCVAAVQAPIIMMSQKRQESKDRLRADNDYRVNLKAELEIRHLHEKLDYLISRQWQRLAEIQQMQIDVIQEQRPPTRRAARRPRARQKPKPVPEAGPS